MLKRPSPSDDDDEILRQQEEYYKQKSENKVKPAAEFVSNKKNDSTDLLPIGKNVDHMDTNQTSQVDIQEQIANTFEAIPSNVKLDKIIERRSNEEHKIQVKYDSTGFPKAVRRDYDIKPKSGSIFAQHIKRMRNNIEPVPSSSQMEINNISLIVKERQADGTVKELISKQNTPVGTKNIYTFKATTAQKSSILTKPDKKSIHQENIEKLNSLSEEEIIAERNKLLASMDPAIVQFLQTSQRSDNIEGLENLNPTVREQNEVAETLNLEDLEIPKELLSVPEATGWLNFDKFEANKLAWMKDISVTNLKQNKDFEARFDFEGYLLPYSVAQIDESNRHLYHHGDEPERPGYTLQELLLLSRSSIIQQRVVALSTLANILAVEQTGIYDKVIDIPIEQVFFVLRVCIDDNTPSILNVAIRALRNLVYFQIDETCLDNTMSFGIGLAQPLLAVDNVMEDDNTVNDQQLSETNLIKCLVRSDILPRIRYIVNTIKPPLETLVYCIEILTRLARDSDFIINKIFMCEGLLSSLVKFFIPQCKDLCLNKENPGYYIPLAQMIKLVRVLSSRSWDIASNLLRKYELLDIMLSYLNEDYFSKNASGMRLQVEAMRYCTVLVHFKLARVSESVFSNFLNTISHHLEYHYYNTDNRFSTTLVRQNHLSALLILIAKIVEKGDHFSPQKMSDCFAKWINQFRDFEEFKCGHSQITSALLYCASMYNDNFRPLYINDCLERILGFSALHFSCEHILNGSLFLNNYETHKTSPNLRSLGAAAWFTMDHIVPVMQSNSSIPLMYALSCCVLSDKSPKVKTKFLKNTRLCEYKEKLRNSYEFYNIGNWFTRCESFLIMNILLIAESVRDEIEPSLYYDIAVKALCVFSPEQKHDMGSLLNNVIFCTRFYPVEIAMENIQIANRNNELNLAWQSLDEIKKVYTDVLGVNRNFITFDNTLCLAMRAGNVIPIDWIYSPLVVLYSNREDRSENAWADFHIIVNSLRWILIYETYFESLADFISPEEKYVRLGCVFLATDDLFLHVDLQELLTNIYKCLLKNERHLDFRRKISGLSNFKDFYMQLLEQYQAVSYSNKVFGNVVLIPLVKRHDVRFRKALWSEYLGVVETLTVTKEEVWVDPEDLIYPADTDLTLCMNYHEALERDVVPIDSILFEVAQVNTSHFKERLEQQALQGKTNGYHL